MRKTPGRVVIVALGAIAAASYLSFMSGSFAGAQIIPSSTTTTEPERTTTSTTLVPRTTTTELPTSSTTAAPTTTAAPPTTVAPPKRTTTTAPGSTTTTFVPPAGVASSTTISVPDGPLDADLGMLPWFVTLSLGGFAVAIAIVTVQWVRTRPASR